MKFFPRNWIFPDLFHGNPDPKAPPGKLQRTWISLEFFGGLRVGSFYSGLGFFLGIKENPRCRWNSKKLGRNPKEIPKSRDFSSLLLWLSPESRAGIPMGASRGSQLPWIPGFVFFGIFGIPLGQHHPRSCGIPGFGSGMLIPKFSRSCGIPGLGSGMLNPTDNWGSFPWFWLCWEANSQFLFPPGATGMQQFRFETLECFSLEFSWAGKG